MAGLTPFEYAILTRLKSSAGEVVSRADIISTLYPCYDPEDSTPPASNSVEVLISRLRRKGHDIKAARGRGYTLAPQSVASAT